MCPQPQPPLGCLKMHLNSLHFETAWPPPPPFCVQQQSINKISQDRSWQFCLGTWIDPLLLTPAKALLPQHFKHIIPSWNQPINQSRNYWKESIRRFRTLMQSVQKCNDHWGAIIQWCVSSFWKYDPQLLLATYFLSMCSVSKWQRMLTH